MIRLLLILFITIIVSYCSTKTDDEKIVDLTTSSIHVTNITSISNDISQINSEKNNTPFNFSFPIIEKKFSYTIESKIQLNMVQKPSKEKEGEDEKLDFDSKNTVHRNATFVISFEQQESGLKESKATYTATLDKATIITVQNQKPQPTPLKDLLGYSWLIEINRDGKVDIIKEIPKKIIPKTDKGLDQNIYEIRSSITNMFQCYKERVITIDDTWDSTIESQSPLLSDKSSEIKRIYSNMIFKYIDNTTKKDKEVIKLDINGQEKWVVENPETKVQEERDGAKLFGFSYIDKNSNLIYYEVNMEQLVAFPLFDFLMVNKTYKLDTKEKIMFKLRGRLTLTRS